MARSISTKIVLFLGLVVLTGCQQFGSNPSGPDLKILQKSGHYDKIDGVFVNRKRDITHNIGDDISFWDDPLGRVTPNYLFNSNQTSPRGLMPEDRTADMKSFIESSRTIKFIWLGHSSILLSIDGKTVLIDPVFSDNASPFSFMIDRFQPPVLDITDLPRVDYIVISHDHYDHLDMDTIKYFANKDVIFILPLGVGSHLRYWGVPTSRMVELDWWGEIEIEGLSFIATPAQHFSGRLGLISTNETLWASWVIKSPTDSIYYSGDSGYDTHYKTIGERFGPFDLVFMDSGQYNERWRTMHNMPEEMIKGFTELGGRYLVPVHWGMFNLSLHNWYDPANEATVRAKQQQIQLITPRLGELITLENPPLFDEWWKEVK